MSWSTPTLSLSLLPSGDAGTGARRGIEPEATGRRRGGVVLAGKDQGGAVRRRMRGRSHSRRRNQGGLIAVVRRPPARSTVLLGAFLPPSPRRHYSPLHRPPRHGPPPIALAAPPPAAPYCPPRSPPPPPSLGALAARMPQLSHRAAGAGRWRSDAVARFSAQLRPSALGRGGRRSSTPRAASPAQLQAPGSTALGAVEGGELTPALLLPPLLPQRQGPTAPGRLAATQRIRAVPACATL